MVRALARGVAAGLAGTAAMTAYQLAVRKARGEPLQPPVPRTWKEAPPPAQVVKRIAGRRVTKEQAPLVATVVHWLYGTVWGALYGAAAELLDLDPVSGAAALGGTVWGTAYAELVPLGISEPPWKQPPAELALDLSYHLVYGVGVAAAYAALE